MSTDVIYPDEELKRVVSTKTPRSIYDSIPDSVRKLVLQNQPIPIQPVSAVDKMIEYSKALIDEFLSFPVGACTKPRNRYLRLRLPGPGFLEEELGHYLAKQYKGLVITNNEERAASFRFEHKNIFGEDVICYEHWVMSDATNLRNIQFKELQSIQQILKGSSVITFIRFSSYSNNKTVKKIFADLENSHKFVLLG